jgi:hypothetical protein
VAYQWLQMTLQTKVLLIVSICDYRPINGESKFFNYWYLVRNVGDCMASARGVKLLITAVTRGTF